MVDDADVPQRKAIFGPFSTPGGSGVESGSATVKLASADSPTTVPDTGALTEVELNSTVINQGNGALFADPANNRVRVDIAGVYAVSHTVNWALSGAAATRETIALLNGAPFDAIVALAQVDNVGAQLGLIQYVQAAVGQFITLGASHTNGDDDGTINAATMTVSGPFPAV